MQTLTVEITDALDARTAKPIVHRNIKRANIFVIRQMPNGPGCGSFD